MLFVDGEMLQRCLDKLIRMLTSAVHVHLSTQQEEPDTEPGTAEGDPEHLPLLPNRVDADDDGRQEELLHLRQYGTYAACCDCYAVC